MARESWGSQLGFMLAAAGSAIGLANIVRFPYLVGKHGGAAFIIIYLLCLLITGFPIFVSEIVLGRNAHSNPYGTFLKLGKNKFWRGSGLLIIATGFIVSSFYSALAGWILGYLFEAVQGHINGFESYIDATAHFEGLISTPWWGVTFHGFFLFLSVMILYTGVRNGLEKFSKILMPLLFLVLIILVIIGVSLPNASEGLKFLVTVDWSAITPTVFLLALGQAFFTLSLGQGTMITYGGYLSKSMNIVSTAVPIVIADSLVSLLASIAVFSIVFSVGLEPASGIGLIFHTFPLVFSNISIGYFLGIAFFLLVLLAAITSEISALEPSIAFLIDEKKFSRRKAVIWVSIGAFTLGLPSALSYSLLKDVTIFKHSILDSFDFLCTAILIPVGALLAIILAGWYWGMRNVIAEIKLGSYASSIKHKFFESYLKICIKYVAPITIIIIAVGALGIF